MSILAGNLSRVAFQGLSGTGAEAAARGMIAAGTRLAAGVAQGAGGEEFEGIPVFGTLAEAVRERGVTASVVYGPPSAAADWVLEAADAGLDLVVCTSPRVPILDAAGMKRELSRGRTKLLGPGSAGLLTPGESLLGTLDPACFASGPVGQVGSGSGLLCEAAWQLRSAGLGTSTAVDLGSDPVRGLSVAEAISLFRADTETDAVLLTGRIDPDQVDECARIIAATGKPVAAFLPVTGAGPLASSSRSRLSAAGAALIDKPGAIGSTLAEVLSR